MSFGSLCDFLEWDSNFFQARIARIRANELTREALVAVDAWAQEEKIDCLYFLADADAGESVNLAEDFNYRLQDVRVELDCSLRGLHLPALPESYTLRPALPSDTRSLIPLTHNSFVVSRFYNDSRFRPKAESLYEIWLKRSIEDNFADKVFIITENEQAQAFITCKLWGDLGSIELIGVSQAARGKRLGKQLVYAALDYFRQEGAEQATVATQARNIRSAYDAADIVLISSFSEGFSNALLEAMAAGKPILASDIPGNQKHILGEDGEGPCGFLYDLNGPEGFVRKAIALVDDERLRRSLGDAGQKKSTQGPSPEDEAVQLALVYERATDSLKGKHSWI